MRVKLLLSVPSDEAVRVTLARETVTVCEAVCDALAVFALEDVGVSLSLMTFDCEKETVLLCVEDCDGEEISVSEIVATELNEGVADSDSDTVAENDRVADRAPPVTEKENVSVVETVGVDDRDMISCDNESVAESDAVLEVDSSDEAERVADAANENETESRDRVSSSENVGAREGLSTTDGDTVWRLDTVAVGDRAECVTDWLIVDEADADRSAESVSEGVGDSRVRDRDALYSEEFEMVSTVLFVVPRLCDAVGDGDSVGLVLNVPDAERSSVSDADTERDTLNDSVIE